MNETVFLQYYWTAPCLWAVLIILNRLLGNHIINLNSKLLDAETSQDELLKKTKINFVFIFRTLLAFPVMIFYWWIFTRFFKLQEIYLLLAGYFIFSYINAMAIQLSSIFPQYSLLKPSSSFLNEEQLQKVVNMSPVFKTGEYFGYLIIYLCVVLVAQNWFIAGGLISCVFVTGKNFISARKMVKTISVST